MPVIIKELVITTTVDANVGQTTAPSVSPTIVMQKEVIQACVEQVLTILKEKAER